MMAPRRIQGGASAAAESSGDDSTTAVPTPDDLVWKALADPTRRQILDLLRVEPLPAGRVAKRFAMSRFGVRKHLQVLHQAGLVQIEDRGRERWHHLNPTPIRSLYHRWIRPFEEPAADFVLAVKRSAEGREETER